MAEDKVYLLTQEAYNKMKEELAHREGELREEIAHKIAVARAEGDLSENGGYQAAREAQSKNEGRITELTVKLRDSKIIENAPEGTVGEGSVVTIELILVPKADIRCAAGREVYFKGEEKKLLSVVDSIFASGYLTEGGQGIEDTLKTITDAGFTYEIESA